MLALLQAMYILTNNFRFFLPHLASGFFIDVFWLLFSQ